MLAASFAAAAVACSHTGRPWWINRWRAGAGDVACGKRNCVKDDRAADLMMFVIGVHAFILHWMHIEFRERRDILFGASGTN